jgi:hypothetical protein
MSKRFDCSIRSSCGGDCSACLLMTSYSEHWSANDVTTPLKRQATDVTAPSEFHSTVEHDNGSRTHRRCRRFKPLRRQRMLDPRS